MLRPDDPLPQHPELRALPSILGRRASVRLAAALLAAETSWLCRQREKLTSGLLAVSWWGGVRIVHRGDKIATPKPNPFTPTKPRFDDPV